MERFRNSRGIPLTFKYLITIIILIVGARSAKQSGIKGGKRPFDPNIIILSECKKDVTMNRFDGYIQTIHKKKP